MPNWLADPPFSLYVLLLVAAIIPLFAAFFLRTPAQKRNQKQKKPSTKSILAAISATAFLLLLALKACDKFVESDREQIERKLKEMSEGVRDGNLDRVFVHVSESFRYGSWNKAQLREEGQRARQSQLLTEIPIWALSVHEIGKDDATATADFGVKAKGQGIAENQLNCRARFVRDPDGEWRLQGFELYLPPGFKDVFQIPRF
jgi:hypothetical protein